MTNSAPIAFWLVLALGSDGSALAAGRGLEVVAAAVPPRVFGGTNQSVVVCFRNSGPRDFEANISLRLYQTSSATAIRLSETAWKVLRVLAGQTVVESAVLDCPPVKAETRLLVQWIEDMNIVIGTTEVLVYPPDALAGLKALAGGEALGLLDPQNQIKPLLKSTGLEVQDLAEVSAEDFRGKLAILGPFESRAGMGESLAGKVKTLARNGVAVVWIQPPTGPRREFKPSFYTVAEGKGTVVVAQAALIDCPADDPWSQYNLVELAKCAIHPQVAQLPGVIAEK